MTEEEVAEQSTAVPLTNPVPGAWIQLPDRDIPPVYVPYEPLYRKNEATGKDMVVGHAPGAHIKRLLTDGAMYTNGPGLAPAQSPGLIATEAALRAELAQTKADREHFMEELMILRKQMADNPNVPNAAKKTR